MEPNTPMNQQSTGMPETPVPSQGSSGLLIGAIVVALLALGAFYFWQQPGINAPESSFVTENGIENEPWIPATSNSDEAAAIEAELEATNMSDFESRMDADIEATDAAL